MDHLWSPWRYRYVTAGEEPETDCIFCDKWKASPETDEAHLVLFRGPASYGLLNLYPYTSGHLMIIPARHVARIEDLPEAEWLELMCYARLAEKNLRAVYGPDGLNLGFNIGTAAGAGIAGHLHLHALPRWRGDANFLTVVAETRVHPEALQESWRKLRACSWVLTGPEW
ncbi:MAG: HIT family protein [Acidobacteriota bacterium]|jgi:ATP adenylyltransferase